MPTEDTSVFAFTNTPDGRAVVYGARIGWPSPSDCIWLIPGTWGVWNRKIPASDRLTSTSP